MADYEYLLSFVLPLLSTTVILYFMMSSEAIRRLALDFPTQRSLHVKPTPRIGGIVAVPVAVFWAWWLTGFFPILLITTMGLCIVSWFDDRQGLPISFRLLFHVIAASVLILRNYHDSNSILFFILAVFTLSWVINLYNFMDGIDGLAGGMGVVGFGALGLALIHTTSPHLGMLCFCISGSVLGFLILNFYPAKIFLGDAGSVSLGFLAGAIAVEGIKRQLWTIYFPLIIFSPFIADATVTLLKRIFFKEKFWQAHREHYYQRLVRMGFGHRLTAIIEYAAMVLSALVAWCSLHIPASLQWLPCTIWYLILGYAMYRIDKVWKMRNFV